MFLICVGPIYKRYLNVSKSKRRNGDIDFIEDPFEGQYDVDRDVCIDAIDYGSVQWTQNQRKVRASVSAFLFLAILVGQGVLIGWLDKLLDEAEGYVAGLVLGCTIKFVSITFKMACTYLTKLEKHKFWSDYRKWDCFKLFVFKVANIIVLNFTTRETMLNTDDDSCALEYMSETVYYVLLCDIGMNSCSAIFTNITLRRMNSTKAQNSAKANSASMPTFVLSDEYVEAVYRSYLVFSGFFVAPAMPLIGLIGCLFEYWLDKYRLLRMCAKPVRTNLTFKNVIVFFYFIVFLAVTFGTYI